MDVQINKMKLTFKQYLILFIIVVLASVSSAFLLRNLFVSTAGNDNEAILFNLKLLSEKISNIDKVVTANANQVKLRDRLDPSLVAEFGDDDDFLQKVAVLKKQIVKQRLESEVVKLEQEKIVRDNSSSNDADIYDSPYKKNVASKLFEVMMINSSSGIAVMRVEDNIISVKRGDNVQGFVVRKINPDSVVMKAKNGSDEVLGLNYLSSRLYEEKKDDEDVKQ